MLNANEIKNVKFSKAMGGYKQEEVEIFLDKIEADYLQFERIIKEYRTKIENNEKEIKELKEAQNSIQSVLLSAQGLADNIVKEAKEKSEEIIRSAESNITAITDRERELSQTFEIKAQERKAALEKELSDMVKQAQIKADSITAAANDSVARQQMMFDKLKIEVASFKASVNSKYKEHLELLAKIPDSVPNDPDYSAKVIAMSFDKAPDAEEFILKSDEQPAEEEKAVESEEAANSPEDSADGFKVEEIK